MPGKTDVFRIVYVDETGNHQAIVFSEPTDGKAYHADQVWVLPGAQAARCNDEGDIPHREPVDYGPEGGGLTWHFQK